MQYQLLASDFDNTLVPFGEPCPRPAVVMAVKKMQAAGGKFVLSTGRGYCVINKQQLGGIRFDYAITNNGACVVDRDGAIIAEHPMTNEEMYALVDFCEDYNYPLQFNFRDGYYAYDVRIEEIHHTQKKDAPSGTAITLAEGIISEIGRKTGWVNEPSDDLSQIVVTSLREGAVPGTHTVTYESDDDRIELKHTIKNRRTLALGAVVAAEFLCGKKGVYTMDDLLK